MPRRRYALKKSRAGKRYGKKIIELAIRALAVGGSWITAPIPSRRIKRDNATGLGHGAEKS